MYEEDTQPTVSLESWIPAIRFWMGLVPARCLCSVLDGTCFMWRVLRYRTGVATNRDGGGLYASTSGAVSLNHNIMADNDAADSGSGVFVGRTRLKFLRHGADEAQWGVLWAQRVALYLKLLFMAPYALSRATVKWRLGNTDGKDRSKGNGSSLRRSQEG